MSQISFEHAGYLVVERKEGADLIDPSTGRWQQFPTVRAAKWSATVYARIHKGFGHHLPKMEEAARILKTHLTQHNEPTFQQAA